MKAWILLVASLLPPNVPAGAASPAAAPAPFVLRDVAAEAGVRFRNRCGSHTHKLFIVEQLGGGAALFDYDFDGDLDLYLVNGGDLAIARGQAPAVANALYRNEGDWRFVDVTARAGVGDTGWGVGAAVGDADGDGDADLYVTNWGRNVFYENRGDGTFREVAAAARVDDAGMGVSASFGDLDGDGDLDLYAVNYLELDLADPPNGGRLCDYEGIATACGPIGLTATADRLYRNDGGLRFTDVSAAAGVHQPEPQYGMGLIFGDYDDDGLTDVFVANDSGPNFLFHNLSAGGELRFEDVAWLAGVATQADGRYQAGMGVDFGDADGDGRPDVFLTNFANDHNTLYRNAGDELFQDVSYPSGLGAPSNEPMGWGTRFHDLDNDADLDLYVANGHTYPEVDQHGDETFRQRDQLFLNDGRGRFLEASERILRGGAEVSRGVAGGDLDLDGDVDLVVTEMNATPSLLRNEGEGHGAWLALELRDRARTEGAGARVRVTAGGRTQRREVTRGGSYASAGDARLHFGLADAARVDTVEVRWPRGKRQVFRDLAAGRRYVICE